MIEARGGTLVEKYFNGKKPQEREFAYRPPVVLVPERAKDFNIDLYIKTFGMKKFKAEDIPGWIICPESYEINNPPNPHLGSDAKYYIDGLLTPDGDALFLYTMDSNKKTSKHIHDEPMSEDYFLLHGKGFMDNKVMERYMYAPTHSNHQITTRDSKVLVMALLRNAAGVPKEEWHKHIEDAA